MAEKKWSPGTLLARAIGRVEAQAQGGSLADWSANEHLACIRYLVAECATVEKRKVVVPVLEKDNKPKLENGKPVTKEVEKDFLVVDPEVLRGVFQTEKTFLPYASNAKKLLAEFGTIDAKVASGGYE